MVRDPLDTSEAQVCRLSAQGAEPAAGAWEARGEALRPSHPPVEGHGVDHSEGARLHWDRAWLPSQLLHVSGFHRHRSQRELRPL